MSKELDINADTLIFTYYIPYLVVNKKYALRKDDNTPSFHVYEHDNRLRWRDWGMPDQEGTSSIDFIMMIQKITYHEAMIFYKDTILTNSVGRSIPVLQVETKSDLKPTMNASRSFTDYELLYWAEYGITKETLVREKIYRLDSLKWAEDGHESYSSRSNPHFVYDFGNDSWKVYAPLTKDKKYKWLSWNLKGVIEGYNTLTFAKDTLIICSSTKDRLVVKNATGFDTIAPTGEASWKYIADKKDLLNRRYKNVHIMYDADEAGYQGSKKLGLVCGFKFHDMRGELHGEKDFADLRKKTDNETIKKVILNLTL